MSFTIRAFAADDLDAVVALMRETLQAPAINAQLLTRDFLLAPGFRAKQLLVAEDKGGVTGFLLAPRHDALGAPEHGWIAAFGVAPAYRRLGIATALLRHAIDEMAADGLRHVDVADVPVRYLLPGVDPAAFPDALRLLRGLGFTERETVASMGIGLDRDFPTAPAIREVTLGELPLVRDFFAEGWGVGWWEHLERSTQLKLAGDSTPSEMLAWWEDGRPIGVAHFRGNRFGPLTVGEATRGRGIGAALTLATLASMQAAGFKDAYFLVGREAVQPFYARLGFAVLRRFVKLTLAL